MVNSIDPSILDEINVMYMNKSFRFYCNVLGKGDNATVYEYKNYAVKVFKSKCRSAYDHTNLLKLQQNRFYPKLFSSILEDDYYKVTIVELIKGVSFFDITKEHRIETEEILSIEKAMQFAYDCGLYPYDVHIDNVILKDNGQLVIIDVGDFCLIEELEIRNQKQRRKLKPIGKKEFRYIVHQFLGHQHNVMIGVF